ncbi:hypothetical protein ACWCQQ_31760 [Streptomyces sp. NPDC002143]
MSMLLALVGGAIADSGTAIAAPPSGSCTQTCNNPPGGATVGDWNAALQAADFWANHSIDFNQVDYYNARSYYHLDFWNGRGWPSQSFGNQWFGYWEPGHGTQFVYYGGRYNDWGGDISLIETYHGGTSTTAFSSGNGRTAPYVEYDIDYYAAPGTARNARRIIRNPNTRNVYVTFDHYQSFFYLGRF